MSNQNVSTTPPEDESDERVIPQETLDEVTEGFIGNKTRQEALDEVIEEFGGRLSNAEIKKLFD